VRLRVTDSDGTPATTSQVVNVANRKPTATFDISPSSPKSGDQITFTSTSTDPDGTIASYAWDLDNDGNFDDATSATAHATFATQGTHRVKLQVTDSNGATDVGIADVQVGNRGPTASIDYSPSSPKTGDEVTFTSASTDSDGSIASYAWDTNNDGVFDNGSGASVKVTFATPGNHTVKLQVTDDSGATDTASVVVNAGNRAPTAAFG
jgi:PKD repeat protein